MAKIIKPGRIQAGWSKTVKCTGEGNGGGGCGAIVLVSEYDIYETSSTAMNETDYYYTFCCPQCGVETDLKGIPSDMTNGKRPSEKERKNRAMANLKRKK